MSEDKLAVVRGRKIGFVFQSYQLIPTLTAEENVLLPHELAGGDVAVGNRARARIARKRRPQPTGWIIIPCSSPAASSSASRWRARSW